MRFVFLLFISFCLPYPLAPVLFAGTSGLITNIEGRRTFSLNGDWQIIIDPYENGYYNYRYEPSDNGYFKNQKPKNKSDLVEYDFDNSETLRVPGDWNTQTEKLLFYEGTIWYKKDFDYSLAAGNRLFVCFGAANYKAVVYLNGEKLGEHEGGFTPFSFEITDIVKEKDNFLIVKVDNKRSREYVPTLNTDWWNYGGLTRDVIVVEVPSTFIKDYVIHLDNSSDEYLSGWLQLDGKNQVQDISVIIPALKKQFSFKTDERGFGRFRFGAQPVLWNPDNPFLYEVIFMSETDTIREKTGFRRIKTENADILLNGEKIFLKGISYHEEAPFRGGRAHTEEDARTILNWIKELNGNFVRLAHYPHNERILRLADEMGIMVWSEIPVYWTILWDNEKTYLNAANQLTEMITRDRNRASVILWSVANETPLSVQRLDFLKRLTERVNELDNTRLITAALENHYINDTVIMIDDPLGEYLDVIGLNEYLGWYDGLPEKIERINYKTVYNKPVIISELGAGALQGFYGDSLTRWTEDYQVNVYEHQIKLMKRFPNLSGMSPWILTDFRSPRRPLPGIQDFYNRKGLISDKGIKKKAFYILKKFYQEDF